MERKLPGEAVERQAIHGTFPRRLRLGRDRRKLEAESENDPAPPWSVRVKRESVAAIARARPPASAALLAGPLLDGCHEPLVLATLVRQTGPVIGICDSRGASRNQVRFLNATDPLVCVVAPAGQADCSTAPEPVDEQLLFGVPVRRDGLTAPQGENLLPLVVSQDVGHSGGEPPGPHATSTSWGGATSLADFQVSTTGRVWVSTEDTEGQNIIVEYWYDPAVGAAARRPSHRVARCWPRVPVLVQAGALVRVVAFSQTPPAILHRDLAQERHPSLVLIDIRLPGIDGIEALRRLRAEEATREILIMAMTASVMTAYRQKITDAGFDAFQSKPLKVRDFVAAVERLLEHPGK